MSDTTTEDETADEPPQDGVESANEYLQTARGDSPIERVNEALANAERDQREARQQLKEMQQLLRESSLACEVLDGVRERRVNDAVDEVEALEVSSDDEQSEDNSRRREALRR